MGYVIAVVVVLAVGLGIYALAVGGFGAVLGTARKTAPGDERPTDSPTGER